MRRAYHPRQSTVHLLGQILAEQSVVRAHIIAPSRGRTTRPARVRIYTDGGHVDLSLPKARRWLFENTTAGDDGQWPEIR